MSIIIHKVKHRRSRKLDLPGSGVTQRVLEPIIMHSCSSEQQGSIGFPSSPKVQALPAATHADEGIIVGPGVGIDVGIIVGIIVGVEVVGIIEGPGVGIEVAIAVGPGVGIIVGIIVGGSDVTQRVPEPIIMRT